MYPTQSNRLILPRASAVALAVHAAFAFPAHADEAPAQPVLQEIRVQATLADGRSASVAGFGDVPLADTPASVSVLTREQMQDLRIRQTTDAVRFDASVNEAYNAVGYAEQFSIRGFELDNNTGYRKDGLAIPADASIPLENKERIEILKGLAGLQAGVASPGGVINYVLKRPTNAPLRSATVEVSERGTLYGAIDLGGRFTDERFGYRFNAASERLRSYIRGADGERHFVAGAVDWQLSPRALLRLDADYQYKSQLTVPGFQLLKGTALPRVDADLMLNDQPWSRPTMTRSGNLGLRFEYKLAEHWRLAASANRHHFYRDDYAAFPYGCSREELWPGFCANGDFDVYDYQSPGERKDPAAADLMLQGRFSTGAVQHVLTVGASGSRRRDRYGEYVYAMGSDNAVSNIYRPVAVPASTERPGPVRLRRKESERGLYVHDVAALSSTLALHAGLRYEHIARTQYDENGDAEARFDGGKALPSIALVYNLRPDWTVYGAWATGLEHGGVAPVGTRNAGTVLDPARSEQLEFGSKLELGRGVLLAASVFAIDKPLEGENEAGFYVRRGDARHRGAELSAQGRVASNVTLGASLAWIDASQRGTGIAAIEGRRVVDVPRLKAAVFGDWTVSSVPGLRLNATWHAAGRKAFDPENATFVPGYHVVNLGASYATAVGGLKTTLRANIDNVADRFYWRDVTQSLGGYLLPGAPRVFKLSAQFDW